MALNAISFLVYLLVSLSLFLILCTTGYIYLHLACVYVTNAARE